MEQKDFDIYEILKGVPVGTKLYTPMCGEVAFTYLASSKGVIRTEDKNGVMHCFDKNGRWTEGGEVMLFPSDRMRDWSKFAWKKGDVLITEDGNAHIIFEKFTDYAYTIFAGKYYYCKNGKKGYTYLRECDNAITEEFTLETEDAAKTIIGKLIGKNESEDTLTFGNQYEIENEKFVTDQAFDLRISVHEELREATEDEAITFKEAYTQWEEKLKEKMSKERPDFKPFDKVLVRDTEEAIWLPAFFVRDRGENFDWRYRVQSINIGKVLDYAECIPYEGNEHLAFTPDPF